MPLNEAQIRRLAFLREGLGPLSSVEALNLALHAEQLKLACSRPGDPAASRFKREQALFEEYAVLLERAGC